MAKPVALTNDIYCNMTASDFVNRCKFIVSSAAKIDSNGGSDPGDDVLDTIYHLLLYTLHKKLRKEDTVNAILEIQTLHIHLGKVVVDAFTVIDVDTASLYAHSDERTIFGYLVKSCRKGSEDLLLLERLDMDTLQELKIVNKTFHSKFVKIKTKLYYKQKKFNLLREVSEGYGRLSSVLNERTTESASNILETIKSLIGCFHLDPNRVLDLILEAFECKTNEYAFFIDLLIRYLPQPKALSEVLGFKFIKYQSVDNVTPTSLYTISALMLLNNVVKLEELYIWLKPRDSEIENEWTEELNAATERYRQYSNNIVTMKEKDRQIIGQPDIEKYALNQKFGLVEALFDVGAWEVCQAIFERLPNGYLMSQPPISIAAFRLLHSLLDPLYKTYCKLGPKIAGYPTTPAVNALAPEPPTDFLSLRKVVLPILKVVGPAVSRDVILMCKIIRVFKTALQMSGISEGGEPPTTDTLYYETVSVLHDVILPSLSCLDFNCCVSEEVWDLIKLFPYDIRYMLYGAWKNTTTKMYPQILVRNCEVLREIKSVMKRISKETTKHVGRLIGKLTHYSPGCMLEYMLSQIILYDNLIIPVVDSLKFLTNLSLDMLGYCIIEILIQPNRMTTKHNGMSISTWLINLACFCGNVYKKYNIELSCMLQYICNQLKFEQSLDLLILNEIVHKMTGIDSSEQETDEQLAAMCGGELLRLEAGYFNHVRNTKRSSQRLKEALLQNNLAISLCLLMAQQRCCTAYRDPELSHLKLVGKLYDQGQDTLVQYGSFIGSTMTTEEYMTRLPSIPSLFTNYHMQADVAFFLARPMLNHSINTIYEGLRKQEVNPKKIPSSLKLQKYSEAVTKVITPLLDSVRGLYPNRVWDDMSPQFFILFWTLSLSDLSVPSEIYQREITRLKSEAAALEESNEMSASKIKKEQDKFSSLADKLQDEKKKQVEHVERVMFRLEQEKDQWFLSKSPKITKNETITQFLQHCLFPRSIFTMIDAIYCAKFIHMLHTLKTPNFSTLLCYDRLFCDIVSSVTQCTENEAGRYGKFLCDVLGTVMRWHSEKEVFDKECSTFPGFVTKFRVSNQFTEASDRVNYENYRHVCHKWHYKITKALVVCLESKEYIQTRNALIILIKIFPQYPVLIKLAQIIDKKVDKVKDDEKTQRQDLFTLATSYSGQLKSKMPQFVAEQDFHMASQNAPSKLENTDVPAPTPSQSTTTNVANGVKIDEKPKVIENTVPRERVIIRRSNEQLAVNEERKRDVKILSKEEPQVEKERITRKEDKKDETDRKIKRTREEKIYDEKQTKDNRHIVVIPLTKDEQVKSKGYYLEEGEFADSELNNAQNTNHKMADRDSKRRKIDSSSSGKSKQHSDNGSSDSTHLDKKEKREKLKRNTNNTPTSPVYVTSPTDDMGKEKKDRSTIKKRTRSEEMPVTDQKKRRSEEKGKMTHQNGDGSSFSDKHHHVHEKSSHQHEKTQNRESSREKHRRSSDGKRK